MPPNVAMFDVDPDLSSLTVTFLFILSGTQRSGRSLHHQDARIRFFIPDRIKSKTSNLDYCNIYGKTIVRNFEAEFNQCLTINLSAKRQRYLLYSKLYFNYNSIDKKNIDFFLTFDCSNPPDIVYKSLVEALNHLYERNLDVKIRPFSFNIRQQVILSLVLEFTL